MHKTNEMEATHLEHSLMLKITHLKEVTVGANGEGSGEHTVMHPLEVQKPLGQVGIHDKNFMQTCLKTLNFQIEFDILHLRKMDMSRATHRKM